MRTLLPTLTLLSALAIPAAAHADTFNFTATGSGGGFSGSGTFAATADGGGQYTITGISGPGINGLVTPGGFNGNDNLLFPASTTYVDSKGFAFTATQTDTDFTVDIFSTGVGTYDAYFLDSDGFSATLPVTFNLISGTPEPSCLLLVGTGLAAAGSFARRRCWRRHDGVFSGLRAT
jgi:hypothetical protein